MSPVPQAFLLIPLVALAVVLSACGSSEPLGPTVTGGAGDPRVADARFDGDFIVNALTIEGKDVPLAVAPLLAIETEFGGLTLNPGCNTYFGSFTLTEDGTASFTIAGGSSQDCADLTGHEDSVLAAFGDVTSWTEEGNGFTFEGPRASFGMTRAR